MKKSNVALDADFLIFAATEGQQQTQSYFPDEETDVEGGTYTKPLAQYKKRFKAILIEIKEGIYAAYPGEVKKVKLFFSDPDGNFRYDLFPKYKQNRSGKKRSQEFYRLRKWALKKYGYVKGVEADDVVAYYVREKGWIGASMDKDLLKGVSGRWFDLYHTRRYALTTSPVEAKLFNAVQTLAGDPSDGIPGIPRVAERTALKLLENFGSDWDGIVKAYESKGLTEEDALLTRRLIGMDQWTPNKGVRLWDRKE